MKAALVSIVKQIAPSLQWCDLEDVVSAALVKAPTCGAQKAVRYALADWLKEQTETPAPVDDVDLKRELQHARRAVRAASDEELAKWDALLARMPEREREVSVRLAAGFSMRDISADMGIGLASADRARKAIAKRLSDPVLWHPILDALYSLPNTKAERAEYVTELAEYRTGRAERSHVLACDGETSPQRKPIFTGWFVPGQEVDGIRRVEFRTWEPTSATGLLQHAFDLTYEQSNNLKFAPRAIGKTSMHLDNQDLAEDSLRPREATGLQTGRRFYFEHNKHGAMLSAPVIQREYDADGMFRRHVQ
jgi:hypothetical protein